MMNKILNRSWDILSGHPSGDKRMIAAYNYIERKYPKYLAGGYDTISYQRALKYILKRKANYKIKQSQKKSNTGKNKEFQKDNKIIKDEKIDVIHSHHRMAAFYSRVLGFFHKKLKRIYTAHNVFFNKKMLMRFSLKNSSILTPHFNFAIAFS